MILYANFPAKSSIQHDSKVKWVYKLDLFSFIFKRRILYPILKQYQYYYENSLLVIIIVCRK